MFKWKEGVKRTETALEKEYKQGTGSSLNLIRNLRWNCASSSKAAVSIEKLYDNLAAISMAQPAVSDTCGEPVMSRARDSET